MTHIQNYWNFERCNTEAKKYAKRSHFKNQSPSAYGAARKNGWLDDICAHMVLTRAQKIAIWSNFEQCKKEAGKYRNKSDFFARNKVAYLLAETNGWLDLFYEDPSTAHHSWWNDKPKSVIRSAIIRGQVCNTLKVNYLHRHFSNGGH